MRYLNYIAALALTAIIIGCSSSDNGPSEESNDSFDRGAMLVNWADNIIVPAYSSFQDKVNKLSTSTASFSANPTVEGLQNLREIWKEAYISFQNVSMFEIGKAEELRFRNRLNTYPTDVSEIEGFIESGVYDFSLPSTIDSQGFPALDYLLNGLAETDTEILAFYTSNTNANKYKLYLENLAEAITQLTAQIVTDWNTGFRDAFVANTSSSASGSVDKLTNDYILYYEKALRAGKVGIPAGVFTNGELPQNVEAYYKKDISKELLVQALQACIDFFNGKSFKNGTSGESFKTYLEYLNTLKDGSNLSNLVNSQFETAKGKVNALNANFVTQIQTDNSKMLTAYNELQRIVVLLKVDMVQAMDISIDYVDTDGD